MACRLVTSLGLAAFGRADTPEEERPEHFLYLDEFQNVTMQSLANFLAELRKFKLAIVMAHQYMHFSMPCWVTRAPSYLSALVPKTHRSSRGSLRRSLRQS